MTDFKAFLQKLDKNLNVLKEREAKHAGQAPLDLLNQIEDHEQAIALTEQAAAGALTEAEWQTALGPLLVSVAPFRAAQQIVAILSQYAPDQGQGLAEEAGADAAQVAGQLLVTTQAQLRQSPTGALIAGEFAQDPETYQKPLEKQLVQAVVADPAFAAQLKTLLDHYHQAGRMHAAATGASYQATLSGRGSIAQGDGARSSTAGEGGIAISGDVQGDVRVDRSGPPGPPEESA